MAEEVAERDPSDAVRVLDPAVLRVSEKVPTPFKRLAEAGRVAAESEDVIATVPVCPLAVLPAASFAVTVIEKLEPEIVVTGTEVRTSEVADPAFTVRVALFETAAPDTVEPSVTDPKFCPVKLAV
jgi:hypothetical protein